MMIMIIIIIVIIKIIMMAVREAKYFPDKNGSPDDNNDYRGREKV